MIQGSGQYVVEYEKDGKVTHVPVEAWSSDGHARVPDSDGALCDPRSTSLTEVYGEYVGVGRSPSLEALDVLAEKIPLFGRELDRMLSRAPRSSGPELVTEDAPPNVVEGIARVCHEANLAYCEYAMGDKSQSPWDMAPEDIRASCMTGVLKIMDNPDITPDALHEEWRKFKAHQGWVYGAEKDPAKKTHPCMMPYGDLPKAQQVKDAIFRAVVLASMTALGVGECDHGDTH